MVSNNPISAIEAGTLGFLPRCFVLTSLPHAKPVGNTFVRVNGSMTVSMVTASNLGLPYGVYPRKLMISITTEAVRTQSPKILLGSSMSSYMKALGLRVSGGQYGSIAAFKNQARRLFGTFISVEEAGDSSISMRSIVPVEEADIWWEPQNIEDNLIWEARITLGRKFFNQITESPIPLDWRVIESLSRSPLAIDVYSWASYRRAKAVKASRIPWCALQSQFGAGYPISPKGTHNFKRKFLAVISDVATHDPEIRRCLIPQGEGLLVKPGKPHVPKISAWG